MPSRLPSPPDSTIFVEEPPMDDRDELDRLLGESEAPNGLSA